MSLFKYVCTCSTTNTTFKCVSKKHFCSCNNYDTVNKCMAIKYHLCICKKDDFSHIYCKAVDGVHYCICSTDNINIFCKNHSKYDNHCRCDVKYFSCTSNVHTCICLLNIELCIATDYHVCMCQIDNTICRSITRHDCICNKSYSSCSALLHNCICDNIYNIHMCKKCEKIEI